MSSPIARKIYAVVVVAAALLSAACNRNLLVRQERPPVKSVEESRYNHLIKVGGNEIYVELASTQSQWQQGLSGREPLKDNQGMLFDMRSVAPARPGFWMKDMKFALDLIWIRNNNIVDITRGVPPPVSATAQLPQYHPNADVDTVLEVNAGWSDAHEIKVGDEVKGLF